MLYCFLYRKNRRAYSPAKGGKKNAFFQKNTNRSACSQDCAFGRNRACGCADFRFQSADFCGDRCDFGYEPHMERLTEGKSDAGCRYFSRIPDRMRFCTLLPWRPQFFLWMAVGTLCVITLCIALRLNFAIPLASIVFADVCLYTGGDAVVYGFHRFTDTMVGLAVALVVNIVIRPYNNRQENPEYDVRAAKAVSPASGGACDRATATRILRRCATKWRSWTMNCVFSKNSRSRFFIIPCVFPRGGRKLLICAAVSSCS